MNRAEARLPHPPGGYALLAPPRLGVGEKPWPARDRGPVGTRSRQGISEAHAGGAGPADRSGSTSLLLLLHAPGIPPPLPRNAAAAAARRCFPHPPSRVQRLPECMGPNFPDKLRGSSGSSLRAWTSWQLREPPRHPLGSGDEGPACIMCTAVVIGGATCPRPAPCPTGARALSEGPTGADPLHALLLRCPTRAAAARCRGRLPGIL